jgi:hypothetical protein
MSWDQMIGHWYDVRPGGMFYGLVFILSHYVHDLGKTTFDSLEVIELTRNGDWYKAAVAAGNKSNYRRVIPSHKGLQRAIKAVFK